MRDLRIDQPVLLFGGPYSNLHALLAMQRTAASLGIAPGNVICTGDVVAYCAEPEETVTAIRDWGIHVIAGNCEQQLAADADDCGCGYARGSACAAMSRNWYEYAGNRVSQKSRRWMAGLPERADFALGSMRIVVVHGGLSQVNRFIFASDRAAIAGELGDCGADIVVAGHAGIPFIATVNERAWFNPGVIGMPANDGTSDVWYGLISVAGNELRLSTHRLSYDHAGAAAAMRGPGYADAYADALLSGLWPSLDVLPQDEHAATGLALREVSMAMPMTEPAL